MIVRNIPAVVAAACMGACIPGCGAAPTSEHDDGLTLPPDGELDESVDAIRGGSAPAGGSGAVIVGARCTGVLIGPGMVLTASHCFEAQMGSRASGWIDDAVTYVANGNILRCITNPTPNTGQCTREVSMFVYRYSVSNVDWPMKDLAILFLGNTGSNFYHVVPFDAADGFYDGNIPVTLKYVLYGQGANTNDGQGSFVMRWMRGIVGSVAPQSISSRMSTFGVCAGDSGGPFMMENGRWVFALTSLTGPVEPGLGTCTQPGGDVVAVRLNAAARQWINAKRAATFHPACTPRSTSSPNYWVCQ